MSNAKKIGISIPPELYEWAAREVEEGRAESVSALVARGLAAMRGRSELEALVRDLEEQVGELDEETMARIEAAERAADEAWRKHLEQKANKGHAA